jgi:hypothetical protein
LIAGKIIRGLGVNKSAILSVVKYWERRFTKIN